MDEAASQPAGRPPLEQLTEDELVRRARAVMARAMTLEPRSTGRAIQWAAYDALTEELERRAIRWAASASPEALAELRAWRDSRAAAGRGERGR